MSDEDFRSLASSWTRDRRGREREHYGAIHREGEHHHLHLLIAGDKPGREETELRKERTREMIQERSRERELEREIEHPELELEREVERQAQRRERQGERQSGRGVEHQHEPRRQHQWEDRGREQELERDR